MLYIYPGINVPYSLMYMPMPMDVKISICQSAHIVTYLYTEEHQYL